MSQYIISYSTVVNFSLQVDYNPRQEAFWFVKMRSEFKSDTDWKKKENEPLDIDK